MKKLITLVVAVLLVLTALAGCAAPAASSAAPAESSSAAPADSSAVPADAKIVVGASPTPHAEILKVAKEVLAAQGYDLEIKEFSDYVLPNKALDTNELDANYFQHLPYLENFNAENGTKLVSAAAIHYEPFGIYPGKTATLDALADGAKVAVPNDATNEARALLLLEQEGLIKLKEGVGIEATKKDIAENPKNLDVVELEAAQIPRAIGDVDIAVINGNYAIEAGLSVGKDAIAREDKDSLAATTYGNIIAVREGEEGSEKIKALVAALQSDAVKQFIADTYDGAVVAL